MRDHQAPARYWFGSDFHMGHKNILEHYPRPFKDMAQQDYALVDEWNKCVLPTDVGFILGDFSFYAPAKTSEILKSMNGQKTLIKGNHDHDLSKVKGWLRVLTYHEQLIDGDRVVMFHNPILSWHQIHRGAYHLHGHCHGSMRYPGDLGNARIMDVGLDHMVKLTGAYRPMEWSEIKALLSHRKSGHSDDHHEVRSEEWN